MNRRKDYYKWISLVSAFIAFSITVIFYFNRVFFDDIVLTRLTVTQFISTIAAVIFSLLSIPGWQSIVSLILSFFVVYGIMHIEVGIH